MSEQEKQEFKDFIFQAVQSGKQETSGLVDDIIHRVDNSIGVAVEKHVNGKIRNLTAIVSDHIEHDKEWKNKADEKLEVITNIKGFGKVTAYIMGVVLAIATAWTAIKK